MIKNIKLRPDIGKEHKPMTKTKEYFLLNIAIILISIGVYFFKFPNHFAFGGVSGISIIIGAVSDSLSPGTVVLILNIALLLLGFAVFGRDFGFKTAYASLLLSFLIKIYEYFIPLDGPLTSLPMLELIYAVVLPGIGAALLFNIKASSGGTDILAMIFKKFTHFDIGKALFATDIIITMMTFAIFDTQTALLSILGLFSKSLLVDVTIQNINRVKYFTIITEKPDNIIDYIIVNLHRGGSKFQVEGLYSQNKRTVIKVVVSNYEAVLLRDFIIQEDPQAFITILNTSQIIGKGFYFNHF